MTENNTIWYLHTISGISYNYIHALLAKMRSRGAYRSQDIRTIMIEGHPTLQTIERFCDYGGKARLRLLSAKRNHTKLMHLRAISYIDVQLDPRTMGGAGMRMSGWSEPETHLLLQTNRMRDWETVKTETIKKRKVIKKEYDSFSLENNNEEFDFMRWATPYLSHEYLLALINQGFDKKDGVDVVGKTEMEIGDTAVQDALINISRRREREGRAVEEGRDRMDGDIEMPTPRYWDEHGGNRGNGDA